MTAADRLAEIRHRHLYDVDLGRWDEDEVGMLDALDAVLALCAWSERAADEVRETTQPWDVTTAMLTTEQVRAAITEALGGGA